MNLRVGWFYPKDLNLYGDRGNVEIIVSRAKARHIHVDIVEIDEGTFINKSLMDSLNFVFMGGGADLSQKGIYIDFVQKKGPYLQEYLESGGVGLFICGSYQLLGNYYKSSDGSELEGLHLLDFYTEHFGKNRSRSVGNVSVKINPLLLKDPYFVANNHVGKMLVGFENHGGRTYLSKKLTPLGYTNIAFGNNARDRTEGVLYKNTIGTYMHGPVLARNPHFADFLLAKSIKIESLEKLDDSVIISAHEKSKNLKR